MKLAYLDRKAAVSHMSIDHLSQLPSHEEGPSVPENQESEAPLQFAYDPSNIPEVSAHDIDEIDDLAVEAIRQGADSETIQAMVYAELDKRGIDYSNAKEGFMVTRFVGVDGKTQIRAMGLSHDDFGVNLRSAELIEQTSPEQGETGPQQDTEIAEAPKNNENMLREMSEEVAALEASLADNGQQRTKLRGEAGRVTQVLRTTIIDQLKRNVPVHDYHIVEVEAQLKGLLTQLEVERATSNDEVQLSSSSVGSGDGGEATSGGLKTELQSLASRLNLNRRNHGMAIDSAYSSCGTLVSGLLNQLRAGRFDQHLVSTLEVAASKIEQGVGHGVSFDHSLRALLKDARDKLGESAE